MRAVFVHANNNWQVQGSMLPVKADKLVAVWYIKGAQLDTSQLRIPA